MEGEISPPLFDGAEEINRASEEGASGDENRGEYEENENLCPGGECTSEEMQQQYDKLEQNLTEVKAQYEQLKVVNARALTSVYERMQLEFTELKTMDLSDPAVLDRFNELAKSVAEGVEKLQAEMGESGKTLQESPSTWAKLNDYLTANQEKIFIGASGLSALSAIIGGVISSQTKWGKTHTVQKTLDESLGCITTNLKTGEIKYIGMCGIREGNQYGTCQQPGEVKVSPTSPLNYASVKMCSNTYPSEPCPFANNACQPISEGGSCDITLPPHTTIEPVCGDVNLLFATLFLLHMGKQKWVPPETSKMVKAVMILSLVILLLTIVWYVVRLFRRLGAEKAGK